MAERASGLELGGGLLELRCRVLDIVGGGERLSREQA